MTLYHNSPRTGLAARCRAKEACPFGTSHGTTIRRDGTVEVGTGSPTWTTMPKPPRRREERVLIDEDGNAVLTYEKPNRVPEPEENTVEKVAEKAAEQHTHRKNGHTPKRINPATGEEMSLFEEGVGDSDDVDNIDFGIEVYDGNRLTNIDDSKKTSKSVVKEESSTTATEEESPELEKIRKSIGDTTGLLLQRYSIREFGDMKEEEAEKLIREVVEDANIAADIEIRKHNRKAEKNGTPTIDTNQQAYNEEELRNVWGLVSGRDSNVPETIRAHIAQKYYRPGDSTRDRNRQRPTDIGQSQQPIRKVSKSTAPSEDEKQRTAGENTIGKYFPTEKFYNLSEGNAKTIASRIAGKAIQDTVGKAPMSKEQLAKAQSAVERNIMKAWRHNNS